MSGLAARREIRPHREIWIFLLLASVVLGAGIGLRDPWPADEPRFALSARQMVASGDWLIPHRGSELYSDKPPTFMALQAATFEVTRNWRVALLLPSLLAALGTLLLVYDLARRLWDRRTGLYAAAALLAALQFVYQAKRAQIDPTVTFFITLANYGLLRHFLLGPDWRAYWLGCFAAGLGVITKGVGILALFMFIPYIFARMRHWQHVATLHNDALLHDGARKHAASRNAWRWLGGAVAFAAALALWLGPMLLAVRNADSPDYAAYAHDILFRQTAGRYTDSWDHQQPVWYYLSVILTGWLPLTLALPWVLPRWRERLVQRDARFALPLAWIALVVVFFSASTGKRDVYILPALPMFALCISPFVDDLLRRAGFKRAAAILMLLIGAGFLGTGLYVLLVHPAFARTLAEQRGLPVDGQAPWWFLAALGAWALACVAYFGLRRGVHGLLAGLAGIWLLWSFWGYRLLNDSNSAAGVMRHAGEIIGAQDELGMVAWKEQNVLMADRAVADFGFGKPWHAQLAAAIRWQEVKPDGRWVFILADAMAPCVDAAKSVHVGNANRRDWWLFKADAVASDCVGGNVPASPHAQEDPNAE